jgi:hypothetical protein
LLFTAIFAFSGAAAQQHSTSGHKDAAAPIIDSTKQRDIIDYILKIVKKDTNGKSRLKAKKLVFSVVPAAGYSLSSGFALDVTSNVAFYTTSSHKENLSAIDLELVYDTKNQRIAISRSEIWFDDNKYKLTTDLRLEKYPVSTYGLGSSTMTATEDPLVYSYNRVWGTFFRRVYGELYFGLGYDFDYHYNITQHGNANGTVSDYTKYGFSAHSVSSGLTANLLFDNRRNPINPLNGAYGSIIYRENATVLGSDDNWQDLKIDLRKYFRVSPDNYNILALWAITEFTSGSVPYLDLPATGSDTYNNFGRGYAEQRFRGKDLLYLEGEYRFGIMKNGFLGGVVFANGETFSGLNNSFQKIAPAAGVGLRIKINKHSDTNVCLDYAYGVNSRGLFVNLGEMF